MNSKVLTQSSESTYVYCPRRFLIHQVTPDNIVCFCGTAQSCCVLVGREKG